MNSTVYIVTTLVAFLLGQWLVTRQHWSGFLVWCVANIYSIVTCILTDMPQTSFLFAAYLIVNFASLRSWLANSRAASRAKPGAGTAVTLHKLLQSRVGALHMAERRLQPETGQNLVLSGNWEPPILRSSEMALTGLIRKSPVHHSFANPVKFKHEVQAV